MAWHIRGNRILSDREASAEDDDEADSFLGAVSILAMVYLALRVCNYLGSTQGFTAFLMFVGAVVGFIYREIIGWIALAVGLIGLIVWMVRLASS